MASVGSEVSGATSLGSQTFDAPRKRRERLMKLGKARPPQSVGSRSSSRFGASHSSVPSRPPLPSKSAMARPPPSPRPTIPSSASLGHISVSSESSAKLHGPRKSLPPSPRASPVPRESPRTLPPPSPRASPRTIQPSFSSGSMKERFLARARSYRSSNASRTSTLSVSSFGSEAEPRMDELANRTTFHVRVSLGYLSGIRMEQLSKRKSKGSQNNLVVGYATLARTGKQVALSQPLFPLTGEEKHKSQKLFWASPKEQGKIAGSRKAKRRLYFSVKLEKNDVLDESSSHSESAFNPEVVKIVVGLKCGEEKLPLGTANLVVNGAEIKESKVDLELKNFAEKSRIGIFGRKQRGVSFNNHDHLYRLASNARLRARVDIRPGKPGENKASVWGTNDESSLATYWSHGTKATLESRQRGTTGMSTIDSYGSTARQGFPVPGGSFARSFNSDFAEASRGTGASSHLATTSQRAIATTAPFQPPMKVVVVTPDLDGRSLTSELTIPDLGFWGSMFHWKSCDLVFCGEDEAYDNLAPTKYFLDEVPSYEEEGPTSGSETSVTNETESPSSASDEDDEDDVVNQSREVPSSKRSFKPSRRLHPEAPLETRTSSRVESRPRTQSERRQEDGDGTSQGAETVDITVETYADLKDAQATLLRYASKAGISMEELLEGMNSPKVGTPSRSGSKGTTSRVTSGSRQ